MQTLTVASGVPLTELIARTIGIGELGVYAVYTHMPSDANPTDSGDRLPVSSIVLLKINICKTV